MPRDDGRPLTPLVITRPPKKVGDMTDDERRAYASELFAKLAKARKPAPSANYHVR